MSVLKATVLMDCPKRKGIKMIFRQLFHSESSTYTYLLGDEVTRESLLIDPVLEKTQETLELINQLGLTLVLAYRYSYSCRPYNGARGAKRKNRM